MKANNILLDVAMSQLGTKEIVGSEHELEVLKYYSEIGHKWVKNDETPWCAAFMNWVCKYSMVQMTEKSQRLRARSFLDWGKTVLRKSIITKYVDTYQGDVVVLWRGKKNGSSGHVGLLIGFSKDMKRVYLLGGNQSNQVKVAEYDASRILDIRRGEVLNDIVFAPKIQ